MGGGKEGGRSGSSVLTRAAGHHPCPPCRPELTWHSHRRRQTSRPPAPLRSLPRRQQLLQIARILADIDPTLFAKLQALGASDCMFAYRMVVVMLRRELPAAELMILWEMQWAHEAADAAATHGDMPASVASTPAAAGASSTAAGIRSTVHSMSDAAARAAAEASGSRPGTPGSRPGSAKRLVSSGSIAAAAAALAPAFILQFIAAVVRGQRSRVLAECHDTDDVLRLFNTLKIEFWPALAQARKQHKAYAQGAAVLHRLAY